MSISEILEKLLGRIEPLGDIYTYKDLEDIKQAEKDKERELLRKAIKMQQKEIEELKKDIENGLKCSQDIGE